MIITKALKIYQRYVKLKITPNPRKWEFGPKLEISIKMCQTKQNTNIVKMFLKSCDKTKCFRQKMSIDLLFLDYFWLMSQVVSNKTS